MPNIQRVGDANTAGGTATVGVPSVRANGRPVIVNGNPVTPHPPCGRKNQYPHCSATTTGGSGSVRAGGIPVIYTGDTDTCATHTRAGGSSDVRVAA
jgi:uncharacterized Zn-binding protein involved in type VI secretion